MHAPTAGIGAPAPADGHVSSVDDFSYASISKLSKSGTFKIFYMHRKTFQQMVSLGLLGGQRRRLYQTNLDRLFNPKNGLSLAFFKKLAIAKNFIKPKLLHKTVLLSNFGLIKLFAMVNFLKNARDKPFLGLKSLSKFAWYNLRR